MSFWQLLGLVSAMALILGVFAKIYGVINHRMKKEGFRLTGEILDKMNRGHQGATKYLADLIWAEGERTRQAVRAPS